MCVREREKEIKINRWLEKERHRERERNGEK